MKEDSGPDRRGLSRKVTSIPVDFYVWDAVEKKALTRKVPGKLIDISVKGACLQAEQTLIDGHHLMLDDDLDGQTPLILDLPPSPEGSPFTVKARVLWYNRIAPEGPFHFKVGLKFIEVSPADRKRLDNVIKSAAASPRE